MTEMRRLIRLEPAMSDDEVPTIFQLANEMLIASTNAAMAGENEHLSEKRWKALSAKCREKREAFFVELRRRFPDECPHDWMYWRRNPTTYRCRLCDARDIR